MGLSGDLRTIDLPEVLQWISRGQQTGTLEVERGSVRKWIAFKSGLIYSSASNDPREHLGQFLVRDEFITEEELFDALLRQETEGWPLGAILVKDGKLSQEQLRRVLKEKAEEAVYDLFLWVEGAFSFKDGEVPEKMSVHLSLDVTAVILEGARRADEWSRIRKAIPSTRATFSATGGRVEDPLERRLVELAAAGKTFAGIAIELRRSDFKTASLLFGLVQRGVLAVNSPVGIDHPSDTVTAISKLLTQGKKASRQHEWDDAANAFEAVLLLDRLNVEAKKGLLTVKERRLQPAPVPPVPLDAVPKLMRDLASLTGESFDPMEGFILSRINGTWPVRAIVKLCPVPEAEARQTLARLVQRGVVSLDD